MFEEQGRLMEAEAEAREALRLKPGYASNRGLLGMILFRQGRHAEAEVELREALELHPALPEYRFNLINALLAQGKTAEAKNLCVDWSQLMGNSHPSYHDIAILALCSPDAAKRNAEIGGAECPKSHRAGAAICERVAGAGLGALLHGKVSRDDRGAREIVRSARRRER